MSKLTHVMIDGGDILDEEELFELLEIGIYVLTVLTRKERDISKSSVKKGFHSNDVKWGASSRLEFGPNDYREDAPSLDSQSEISLKTRIREAYFHQIKSDTKNF